MNQSASWVFVFSALAVAAAAQGCGGDRQHDASGGAAGGEPASSGGASADGGSGGAVAEGSGGGGGDAGGASSSSAGGSGGAAPASCSGYEPCGVNPVVAPDGYTLLAGLTVFNQSTNTSCTDFSDCDMWNTHFDMQWAPPDNGYNRMGSPFPWPMSRYIIVAPPKKVTYAKLHMTSPGDLYRYSDGTPETNTDPSTHVTTCYQRGPGHLTLGYLENMGGTGNSGKVAWNISVLPGDMGNSGNVSTCQGTGATTWILITSDEATAQMKNAEGKYDHCLLREGHDYYVNVMSSGMVYSVDCSTEDCTMGGFAFTNPATSDGSAFLDEVPCP